MSLTHNFDVHKTREIHFDALIAFSARSIGGAVITANQEDFERIKQHIAFEIVIPT